MKYLLTATAAALLIAGPAQAHDDDDIKRDVVAEYDFSGFDSIDVSGVYLLDIQAGDRFSIRTEATSDSAKWLDVRLKDNTLILGKKKRKSRTRHDDNHEHGVRAIITMPRLLDLDVSGVTTGEVSAFTGGNIDIDTSGVSELRLSGQCDTLNIDVGGVGEVDAEDLKCDHVDADIGGIGELSVYAAKSIRADSGGMSTINVYGNPPESHVDSGRMSKVKMR